MGLFATDLKIQARNRALVLAVIGDYMDEIITGLNSRGGKRFSPQYKLSHPRFVPYEKSDFA
jgi:hypothetical protein